MIYMSPMQSRQMTAAFVNTFPNPPQRMPSASMTRNTVMKKHAGLIRRNSEPITCLYGVGLTGIVWTEDEGGATLGEIGAVGGMVFVALPAGFLVDGMKPSMDIDSISSCAAPMNVSFILSLIHISEPTRLGMI